VELGHYHEKSINIARLWRSRISEFASRIHKGEYRGIALRIFSGNAIRWNEKSEIPHICIILEEAGILKSDIVLGFQPPHVRPCTEYAVD
jgi:hypothetical protein